MKYAKAVVAAASSFLAVVTAVVADNVVGADEVGSLVSALLVAVAGVVAVVKVPNADV